MENLTIRKCSVEEIYQSDGIDTLLSEYADECSIKGIGKFSPQFDTYKRMESAGALHVVGAFIDSFMVGFISVIVSVLPHYGKTVAVTESFFVGESMRHTGAGLKLMNHAEKLAIRLGAVGLLVSAPFGGKLAEVLPRRGFEETNRVFFKELR